MSRKYFQHLSDEALLEYYHSSRNFDAFCLLYERHKDSLYRYCAQMDLSLASVLLEELWKNLLEKPPRLGGRLLKSWLFIHINKLLRVHVQQGVEDQAQRQHFHGGMLGHIQQLSRVERNILLLHMECQLPLATVADIERISLKKCRAHYQDGKRKLDEFLHGPARQPWRIEEASA